MKNTFALHSQPQTASIFSLRFVRAYIVTMRPYLLFVSGITAIVGLAFAPQISIGAELAIATSGFLAYGFGQALTDCTQTDTDAISSPYRPLVRGEVKKVHILLTSLIGLAVIGIVYISQAPYTIFLTLAGTAGLATYTWFKRRWWGGPFWNSWIVVVLAIVSFIAATGSQNFPPIPKNFLIALVPIFFGYANFVLSGYYKDIEADRATAYHTLPVAFGRKVSNYISDAFSLIAICGTLAAIITSSTTFSVIHLPAIIAFLSGVWQSVIAQVKLHKVRTDDEAHEAIAPVVHSYILLLSSIALTMKPSWWWILGCYYLAYLITMKLRPLQSQI